MLARSGRLPTSGDYAYEAKWDGFRAIASTEGQLRVRSRRGWDMTEHVGFLAELPVRAVLDGELVALDGDGKPDFPQLCECVLMRRTSAPLTFMVFDVLSVERKPVVAEPYSERRRILESLRLNAPRWRTPEAFDDGHALWEAVSEHELEGVVAKRRSGRYVPGGRRWIKAKNSDYWRMRWSARAHPRSGASVSSFELLWIAELFLGAYLFAWLALGGYETTRIRADGVAEICVATVAVMALGVLGWWRPYTAGLLLVVPVAFPLGLASAAFLVSGIFEPPHSLLQAANLGHAARAALAYGFLIGVPLLAGVLFIRAGRA
jgi:ATP dependent DNA ligase-like protein